jgi:hypothetical protein
VETVEVVRMVVETARVQMAEAAAVVVMVAVA